MTNQMNLRQRYANRRGAMLPLIAVAMVILFVAAVLAIDIANIHVVRSELRTATDAAARAAVEALGRNDDRQEAIDAALAVAQQNSVAGNGLDLDPANIAFGNAELNEDGSFDFIPENGAAVNTVRVIGTRTAGSPDGPVNTLFGPLFDTPTFEPVQTATATRLDRDIALVLDKSGSMSQFGRFEALLNGVQVFISELNNTRQRERVSLTVYDTFPRQLVELTPNLPAISEAISQETPGGFTGIGRALQVGLDSVQTDPGAREYSLKSIILMTDGNQNRGVSPVVIARRADELGITVHTITFSSGADQALMQEVAEITGGTHLHAENNQQLIESFQEIARQLQVLLIE